MSIGRIIKKMGIMLLGISMLGLQVAPAQAAMVGTEQLIQNEQLRIDRAQLLIMLEREEVRAQLIEMGVDMTVARERIAGLTQSEIEVLNEQLGELPAGGDVLVVMLVIFLVFIMTDVLGVTDIFPFIHPAN